MYQQRTDWPPNEMADRAAFLTWAKQGIGRHIIAYHFLGNYIVTVEGDTAKAIAYMHSAHLDGNERAHAHGDRFTADLVRTPQGWRIARLAQTELWRGTDPAKGPLSEEVMAQLRAFLRPSPPRT